MRIAIFGLGYVGLTTAACLASQGHEIVGIEPNKKKVEAVNLGKSPTSEPGVELLIEAAVEQGKLSAYTDCLDHLNGCEMAMVCVGTPGAPDGAHDLCSIVLVSHEIAAAAADSKRETPLTVVYRSTMPPGTMDELVSPIFDHALKQMVGTVELVYNPEFLRRSVAVEDFFNPPKIVTGTRDGTPCAKLDALYGGITAPVFHTGYREAELTKFVDNAYHTVKVAFANEIGRVCDRLGIPTETVHKIFVSDTKLNVSPDYTRPGGAFGGAGLVKDVRAMQHFTADLGVHTGLIDSLLCSNEEHNLFLLEKVSEGLTPGSRVLMLGLAFKAATDDLRESPNVDLARKLLQAGFKLSIYDPEVNIEQLGSKSLSYAFTNLPTLRTLLASKAEVEEETYDAVLDMHGKASSLNLHADHVIDLSIFN